MKTILPLLLLLLVACDHDRGNSHKKKAEPQVVVVPPPVVVEPPTPVETSFDQDVRLPITIFHDEIHLTDFGFGKFFEKMKDCGPSPEPGKIYSYHLNGDRLVLDDRREEVIYTRVRNDGGLVRGLWQMVSSTDRIMKSGTLEIFAVSARFISHCELE